MALVLITVATFLVVSGIVVSGYYAATADSPVAERLKRLVPEAAVAEAARPTAGGRGSSAVKQLLAALGQYGFSGNDRSLTRQLSIAGIRGGNAAMLFLGARTLISVGPALLLLVPQVSAGKPLARALWVAGLTWAIGHLTANYWLKRRARQRVQILSSALPDSLDLMVVCLEAGLSLNATIARVGEERAAMRDPLGDEFAQVSLELREGRTREDALRALGERNGIDDLKSLAGLIIQSDRLGASMAKTLRAHADVLRTKRRQRAEELARKLPIKMLFPLALFVLPPLLITAAGPALLRIKDMIRVVTGG